MLSRYTDPPSHIVGEDVRVFPAMVDEGRSPLDEDVYAKLSEADKERTPIRISRPRRVTLSDEEAQAKRPKGVTDLALVNGRAPGDVVAMTAVVRELHRAHPGKYRTVIQTQFPELWENNPHVTMDADIVQPRRIDWDWSNKPMEEVRFSFTQIWRDDLARQLGIAIPMKDDRGDIHLSDAEREWPTDLLGAGPRKFGIVNAGVKSDMPTKQWGRQNYQAVVDHFAGQIEFVQIGLAQLGHDQQPLNGVTDLIGQTEMRALVRLIYWSDMVLCGVTLAMHLSAAIPARDGGIRPCIVLVGGREPSWLTQYNGHTQFSSIGSLPCCKTEACWRSKFPPSPVKDEKICTRPVQLSGGETVGECMRNIRPSRIIGAIEGCGILHG